MLRLGIWVVILCVPTLASAEQPVFGMMPRWANGWGVQTQYELEDTADERSQLLHIEGVYTWARWIRVTYKIPFIVHGRRTGANEAERGLGTPVLALPLKVLQS